MRWIVAVLFAVHGLIHLMGFAKAFGYAKLPQLTQPISREMGLLWFAAGLLVVASAAMIVARTRGFWIVGGVALVVSQAVILSAWHDARAGTVVNIVLLLAVAHGWFTEGPTSFLAQFERDVAAGLARPLETHVVTEADLTGLPEPVGRYLRATGVVGQPRVWNYRLRFRGRIRGAPGERWMPFDADQQSFAEQPARLFLMRARMIALPVEAFHRLIGGHATMQVKIAGAIPMVDARGDVMDRSEAVTLFNDMCLMAPATLVDPAISWTAVDADHVRATFSNAGHTIHAELVFNAAGELVDFWSDDRRRLAADGRSMTAVRWSTPVSAYRQFGAVRLMHRGEARWHEAGGDYAYIELEIEDVQYNVG